MAISFSLGHSPGGSFGLFLLYCRLDYFKTLLPLRPILAFRKEESNRRLVLKWRLLCALMCRLAAHQAVYIRNLSQRLCLHYKRYIRWPIDEFQVQNRKTENT